MAKILIVDDSRLARTFSAACLRKQGHEILEAEPTSVFDVLKAARRAKPDLLIMDFLMPNCPGQSLARACHEFPDLESTKLLVLTAHRDDEVTRRLKNMGVAEVLFKPVEPQALADCVQAVLAGDDYS
jgi:DNA-binding NarL/FixJ family response regulator